MKLEINLICCCDGKEKNIYILSESLILLSEWQNSQSREKIAEKEKKGKTFTTQAKFEQNFFDIEKW